MVSCIGLSIWGIQMGGDAVLVATYAIGLLTMPAGLIIYVVGSLIFSVTPKADSGLGASLMVHALAIFAGYFQWFVLLPHIVNRMRRERSPVLWGLALVVLSVVLYGLYRFYNHVFPADHL